MSSGLEQAVEEDGERGFRCCEENQVFRSSKVAGEMLGREMVFGGDGGLVVLVKNCFR